MTPFTWSVPPEIPRNASVIVEEAWVPMLLWPSVPMIRVVYEELTVVDRFMVESALALAPMHAEDIEEVTTIPRDAVTRIAGRLTGLGLLRADGGGYFAVESTALAALERRSVPEHRTAFLTILYLPSSDDMVAFTQGPGRPDPPLLQKVKAVQRAPLPPDVVGMNRAELLRDRIQTGRIAELPEDIVDAVDGAAQEALPDSCPAYRCRGHVRWRDSQATLVLDVLDGDGKRAAQCRIPGAVGQAAAWVALASQAKAAGDAWQVTGGEVAVLQDGPAEWAYKLDGAAAEAAAREGLNLSQPAGLQIHHEDGVVAVRARFLPSDYAATRVFALHHAIRTVIEEDPARLVPDAVAVAAATARSTYGLADDTLTESELAGQLWTDCHYRHVYALRATRDFAYD